MQDDKKAPNPTRRHRSESAGIGLVKKELDQLVFSVVKKEVAERKRPSFKISQKLEKDPKNCDYLLKRAFVLALEENLVTEPLEDLNNFFSLGKKSIDGYRLRASLLIKRYEWMNACGDLLNLSQLFKRKIPVHTYATKRFYKPATCSVCSEKFGFNDEGKVCIHCKTTLHDGVCREKHEKTVLVDVYHLRGITRYYHEDYEKAVKDFTKAIRYCDDEKRKLVFSGDRGLVFFYLGRLEESLVDLEAALAHNTTHEHIPRMIAAAYFRLNKIPEAKAAFSRAQELSPSLTKISADEFFPYDLPEKILQEVFYQLSVKDRIQFVCTCRKWYGILLRLRQVFQKAASEDARSPERRSRRSHRASRALDHEVVTSLEFSRTPCKESPRSDSGSPGSIMRISEEEPFRGVVRRSKTMWNVEQEKSPCTRRSKVNFFTRVEEGAKGGKGDEVKPAVENGSGGNNFHVKVPELELEPVPSIPSPTEACKRRVTRSSNTPRGDSSDLLDSLPSNGETGEKITSHVSSEVLPTWDSLSLSPNSKKKMSPKLRSQNRYSSPKEVRRTKTREGVVKPRLRVDSEPESRTLRRGSVGMGSRKDLETSKENHGDAQEV